MVEIATVGDEGLVGINAFLGGEMLSAETMLQVPASRHERGSDVREGVQTRKSTAAAHFSECCATLFAGTLDAR